MTISQNQISFIHQYYESILKGDDLIKYNFVYNSRTWLFKQKSITIPDVVNYIFESAPKVILKNRNYIIEIANSLWLGKYQASLIDDNNLNKQLENELEFHLYNIL